MPTMGAISTVVIRHTTSVAPEVIPPTHIDRIHRNVEGFCLSVIVAVISDEDGIDILTGSVETHV